MIHELTDNAGLDRASAGFRDFQTPVGAGDRVCASSHGLCVCH
jgi:hypothetical protein